MDESNLKKALKGLKMVVALVREMFLFYFHILIGIYAEIRIKRGLGECFAPAK